MGDHRVVLEFDDGLHAKLICPEAGCVPAANCASCGRAYADAETEPCYDCREPPPDECWIKTWFDNCSPEELLHGEVTVNVDAEWDGDSLVATIAEPSAGVMRRPVASLKPGDEVWAPDDGDWLLIARVETDPDFPQVTCYRADNSLADYDPDTDVLVKA